MKRLLKVLFLVFSFLFAGAASGLFVAAAAYMYVADSLPDVETLKSVQLEAPLRVYSRDGVLIGEFGEKRRIPVTYAQLPETVVNAFVAAEDDRFFEHPGVDYQGLLRAAIVLARTGEATQGGSTITMQVARNYLLTLRRTMLRKVREIFVALNMERVLTKQEILTLYLNKIFFGQRAYGVAAAAEVYFGKTLADLRLDEVAILAGLPKAPSDLNPIASPVKAKARRDYVLRRMLELGYVSPLEYEDARSRPVAASLHAPRVQGEAAYLAEMVRAELVERFGSEVYDSGYRVVTTLDAERQQSAVAAVRRALIAYDRRHGYRGPLDHRELPVPASYGTLEGMLAEYPALPLFELGIVTEATAQRASVHLAGRGPVSIGLEGVKWARPYESESRVGARPEEVTDVLAAGDVVYLRADPNADGDDAAEDAAEETAGGAGADDGAGTDADATGGERWILGQAPAVQGALVSLDPLDGAVVALVGGYDFLLSKYNRATQSRRQPGSSFKPFIYSAALENGFTTASVISDAPVVYDDPSMEEVWRPENYEREFRGPMRLREALVASRNLVSIRVLREVGVSRALAHLERFGFDAGELPRSLSLALGSASLSPMQMASAYAVLSNGGFHVSTYFIDRIEDGAGLVLYDAEPDIACPACERFLAAREADEAAPAASAPEGVGLTAVAVTVPAARGGPAGESSAGGAASDVDTVAAMPSGWPEDAAVACTPVAGFAGALPLHAMAERAVSAQNVYLVTDMMRDVIRRGTGRRAWRELRRADLAGKTGTTNEQRDAWFSGFNADLVASVWVGFDDFSKLGRGEVGGRAALPAWIDYMGSALEGQPEHSLEQPFGLVSVKISPETGMLAGADEKDFIYELFRADDVPEAAPAQAKSPFDEEDNDTADEETSF